MYDRKDLHKAPIEALSMWFGVGHNIPESDSITSTEQAIIDKDVIEKCCFLIDIFASFRIKKAYSHSKKNIDGYIYTHTYIHNTYIQNEY